MAHAEAVAREAAVHRVGRWWYHQDRAWLRAFGPARWLHSAFHISGIVLVNRLEGQSAVGVMTRLWLWQVWRRAVNCDVTIKCAEGSLMTVPVWSRLGASLAATGLTERDDALFVIDFVRGGETFVDVGSNIGFYTVLAGRRGAQVHAFDPTPAACDICERNLWLNHIAATTTVHRAACGDFTGVARFTVGLDITNHIVGPNENGVEVEMVSLDDHLPTDGPAVAMIKVDAEGHDLAVLRGAMLTIARDRPAVLIEVWAGGADVTDLLAKCGYRPYAYHPSDRKLLPLGPDSRRSGNLLLLPTERVDAIQCRLKSAIGPALTTPTIRWGTGCAR